MTRKTPYIYTAAEKSAHTKDMWVNQYKQYPPQWTFFDGITKAEMEARVVRASGTPKSFDGILGKDWTHPRCDVCYEYHEKVAVIADDDEQHISICAGCADRVANMLRAQT